jgi:soluble lytic murein transglycosylase-like protein
MATNTLLIPQMGLKLPVKWGKRYHMVDGFKKGWAKYGKFFKQASETSKIPVSVLMAFAMVESGFNPNADTGATTGMMQWNRSKGYADKILSTEFKMGRMSEKEKEILKRKGVKWDAQGNFAPITASQQLDPELNILIGSIYIGQYADSIYNGRKEDIEWGTDNGVLRLDRIITVYNTGGGAGAGKRARTTEFKTPLQTANALNPVTASYIHKILGTDGALDVATKEYKDIIA